MADGAKAPEGLAVSGGGSEGANPRQRRSWRQLGAFLSILALVTSPAQDARAGEDKKTKKERKEEKRIRNRQLALTTYTRYYEERMGLTTNQIDFLPIIDNDKLCGHIDLASKVTSYGVVQEPAIVFSTSEKCEKVYSARKLALHETCHWRMQHAYQELTYHQKEEEVAQCMEWYNDKPSKKSTFFKILAFILFF